jgi:uncharacterized protein (TIGR02266 family)
MKRPRQDGDEVMSQKAEMRKHPRLTPLIIKAEFESAGARGSGYLTNLSKGGAFLATDLIPSPDESVTLQIALPWRLGKITAVAKVVWHSNRVSGDMGDRPYGVGLAFTDLPAESEEKLQLYIERFSELAAQIETPS